MVSSITVANKLVKSRHVILLYSLLSLVFFVLLSQLEKGQLVLFFNARYTEWSNIFFKYFTYLGEGIIFIPLVLLALFYRYRSAITLVITGVLLGITTAVLKQVVYTNNYRPKRYFDGIVDLNFVHGVDIHGLNSFPSGHTATAAAISIWIALEFRSRSAVMLGIVYVSLIAISRVYLAQHFLIDVTFGMLEGFAVGGLTYFAVRHYSSFNTRLERRLSF